MASIGKYGFINAKVRAMRSFLLTESIYRTMAGAGNVEELLPILAQTHFRNVIQRLKESDEIEQELLHEEIRQIRLIQKYCHKNIAKLISLFLERFDCERLKVLLRYWHRKKKSEPPVLRGKIVYELPIDAIVTADTLGEMIVLLEGTPFQNVLSRAAADYQDSKTLFPLELAIDRDFFIRMLNEVESLPKKDWQIARRLLGLEIDLRNIDWIVRLRTYYDLSSAEIRKHILPHGSRISGKDVDRIVSGVDVSHGLIKATTGVRLPEGMGSVESFKLEDLEHLLYHILSFEARKAFGQFPFSIGSILGYLVLLRIETKNIRTLFQAKEYGFSAERTEALLIL